MVCWEFACGGAKGSERRRVAVWRPVVVNLALGVLAVVPLYCAYWLLTEYVPMDCDSMEEALAPGFTGECSYPTLDHAPFVMVLLAVTGLPLLVLLAVVDVGRPLARRQRLGPWLGAAALALVPFGVLWAAAQL